jgi:urea transport system substrate-binding protein
MSARTWKADSVLLPLVFLFSFWLFPFCRGRSVGPPIKVGILHSMSGTMGLNGKPVAEATLLAIEEINNKGGLLGKKIQQVVVDARSDPAIFAQEAARLITEEKVCAIFGCWTSSGRKSVKVVVEKYNHLLFYPLQYEGLEQSPNIVYLGAAPNQQIIPAVKWCFDNLGKRFFLVGSDYVFPRTANAMIKDQLAGLQGEIVGEEYILLGSRNVDQVVQKIAQVQPNVILSTINGDSNFAFFEALRREGITSNRIPTMSFSIGESELSVLGPLGMAGNYAAWNYFQNLDNPENAVFTRKFKEKYGSQRVVADPMEAGYFGVYLWAQAVRESGSAEPAAIRKSIDDQSFLAPEGLVYVDRSTHHTWKTVRIGKIRADGQFDILWSSDKPIRPVPYPLYRFKSEWDHYLLGLYQGWGGQWTNPGR